MMTMMMMTCDHGQTITMIITTPRDSHLQRERALVPVLAYSLSSDLRMARRLPKEAKLCVCVGGTKGATVSVQVRRMLPLKVHMSECRNQMTWLADYGLIPSYCSHDHHHHRFAFDRSVPCRTVAEWR
jgi:hypothetical protein